MRRYSCDAPAGAKALVLTPPMRPSGIPSALRHIASVTKRKRFPSHVYAKAHDPLSISRSTTSWSFPANRRLRHSVGPLDRRTSALRCGPNQNALCDRSRRASGRCPPPGASAWHRRRTRCSCRFRYRGLSAPGLARGCCSRNRCEGVAAHRYRRSATDLRRRLHQHPRRRSKTRRLLAPEREPRSSDRRIARTGVPKEKQLRRVVGFRERRTATTSRATRRCRSRQRSLPICYRTHCLHCRIRRVSRAKVPSPLLSQNAGSPPFMLTTKRSRNPSLL